MTDNNKALFRFIRAAFSILVIVVLIYVGAQAASKCYEFGYRVFTEPAMEEAPGSDVMVLIKDDMSEHDVAQLLEEKGLVRDSSLFYLQLKLSAYSGDLLPGVYTLNTSMEPKTMMVIMATAPEEETEDTESTAVPDETVDGTEIGTEPEEGEISEE